MYSGLFRVVCVRSTVDCSVTQWIPVFLLQCFTIHHVTTVVDAPEIPLSLLCIPQESHQNSTIALRVEILLSTQTQLKPFCVDLFKKDFKVIGFGSFLCRALAKRLPTF